MIEIEIMNVIKIEMEVRVDNTIMVQKAGVAMQDSFIKILESAIYNETKDEDFKDIHVAEMGGGLAPKSKENCTYIDHKFIVCSPKAKELTIGLMNGIRNYISATEGMALCNLAIAAGTATANKNNITT